MENPVCIPLNCRGLQVLGFPYKDNKIYICVHQLAIELWKAFDTPRVSIQRKIIDLGIKIASSDRNMIRTLRAAGVIENFRATMILIKDAEILCDALELSRKKRGLVKHALQAKHRPEERSTRREEQRAKKFTAKMKSLYNVQALQSQAINSTSLTSSTKEPQLSIHNDSLPDEWASYRISPTPPYSPDDACAPDFAIDTLLVVEEATAQRDHEIGLEFIPTRAWKSDLNSSLPRNLLMDDLQLRRDTTSSMGSKLTSTYTNLLPNKSTSLQPIRSSDTSTNPRYDQALSPHTNWDIYEPLSSPASEMEEARSVVSSVSSRSRHPSGSNTPERFLYLQESGESDFEDSEVETNPSRRQPRASSSHSMLRERVTKEKPIALSKRVIATKLRHFAQTSSPRASSDSSTNKHSSSKPALGDPSLPSTSGNHVTAVVTKRKRGRPPKAKHLRPTALSSFATKKRAMSRSPSPLSSDGSLTNTHTRKARRLEASSDGNLSGSSKVIDGKVSTPIVDSTLVTSSASINKGQHETQESTNETINQESLRLNLNLNSQPDIANGSCFEGVSDYSGRAVEDDQVSIASMSTNSTNSSGQRSTTRPTRRTKALTDDKDSSQIFRFNDLFNFYPPRLVVKDGELVPEHSLSVRKLDRNSLGSLPDAHPFLNWSLGHPVSGKGGEVQSRNGRKRKALS